MASPVVCGARYSPADDTLADVKNTNILRPIPVVRLIVPDGLGRVLILQRAAESTRGGTWCLPGGKIDYCDTVERAAARELQEETGLHATSIRFLFYQDSLPPSPGQMHCINLYLECAAEGSLELNGESTDSKWIGKDDLQGLAIAFRNDEALVRYWKEASCRQATR
jgi:8-oxo-dGTP diphosphatase